MEQKNKINLLSLAIVIYYQNSDFKSFLPHPPEISPFGDLLIIEYTARTLNPYIHKMGGSYFPLSYIFVYPFGFYSRSISALIYSFIFIGSLFRLNYYFIGKYQNNNFEKIQTSLIFTLLTYPTLFTLERGNIEGIITIFCALSIIFYIDKKYILSAVILGLAAAMKGYAGIFIFLFILDKRWKESFITCATTGLSTLFSLLLFRDELSVQIPNMIKNFGAFTNWISSQSHISPYSSDLFDFFDFYFKSPENHNSFMLYYTIGAALFLASVIAILFLCKEKVLWKKIAAITCCSLLLPQSSFDYHMMRIYLPLWLFINYNSKNIQSKKMDYFYTIIFATLLIPKHYFYIFGHPSSHILSSTALLMMLGGIMIENIINKFKNQAESVRNINFTKLSSTKAN